MGEMGVKMITTKEPDDDMLKVAIESINAVCDETWPDEMIKIAADGTIEPLPEDTAAETPAENEPTTEETDTSKEEE